MQAKYRKSNCLKMYISELSIDLSWLIKLGSKLHFDKKFMGCDVWLHVMLKLLNKTAGGGIKN
jgi:hypothetical protein